MVYMKLYLLKHFMLEIILFQPITHGKSHLVYPVCYLWYRISERLDTPQCLNRYTNLLTVFRISLKVGGSAINKDMKPYSPPTNSSLQTIHQRKSENPFKNLR